MSMRRDDGAIVLFVCIEGTKSGSLSRRAPVNAGNAVSLAHRGVRTSLPRSLSADEWKDARVIWRCVHGMAASFETRWPSHLSLFLSLLVRPRKEKKNGAPYLSEIALTCELSEAAFFDDPFVTSTEHI